jgi:hypothetical protein
MDSEQVFITTADGGRHRRPALSRATPRATVLLHPATAVTQAITSSSRAGWPALA